MCLHMFPELHSAVKESAVGCLTVNTLLNRNNVQKISFTLTLGG